MKKRLPPLGLFFLAPAVGELLSGSAPPAEFLNPLIFFILLLLYGGGAVLVREVIIRWRKGWPSLLALGAAYAIIEEGLMVKSFFDPAWMDLGKLATYGRWLEVNWAWSLELIIYHAVISIAIPILIVHLIFPSRRDEPWLGKSGATFATLFFAADVAFGAFILTPFWPGLVQYWGAAFLVVVLILLAWLLPRGVFKPGAAAVRNPFRFWLAGFFGWVVFFLIFAAGPELIPVPAVVMVLCLALAGGVTWLVMRLSGNTGSWRDTQRLALAAGPLSFFILFTPIREYVGISDDNPAGMVVVGIIAAVLLIALYVRTSRRVKEEGHG